MNFRLNYVVLAATMICGYAFASDIRLPNGYAIIESQPKEHNIVHDVKVIVFGNVERYAVVGNIVMGFVTKPDGPKDESDYYHDVRIGRFILDTKTGMLVEGLDDKSWVLLLEKFGIRHIPDLKSTCFK